MRVLLFTGKGGVGKTTVAAATAVRSAAAGQRTLVMCTDPAHSLGDSFEVEIGSTPRRSRENLWAQQIDAQERLEDNWREIQDYMIQLMNWAGTETIQAEELTVLPGTGRDLRPDRRQDPRRERGLRRADRRLRAHGGDAAPALASRVMNWYIERIFPVERRIVKTVRPIVSRMTSLPIAGDQVFAAIERLHRNLDAVKKILTDEKIVVRPAGREPGEDGDRRSEAHLHVPGTVRLSRGRRRREPGAAAGCRPTPTSASGRTSRRSTSPPCTSRSTRCRS